MTTPTHRRPAGHGKSDIWPHGNIDLLEQPTNLKPGERNDHPRRKKPDSTEFNDVEKPEHYNQDGKIECIDGIEASMSAAEFHGYLKGNTIKYLWRYTYKGKPLEDLKKAGFYLNKLTGALENLNEPNE